jgi:mediator of RNA polymerase II transcription subunit 13
MKASELARPPVRSPNPAAAAAAASTSSPFTQAPPKGLQTGATRFSHGASQLGATLDQQQQFDSFTIYELFTSSVVALISYHLVRDHAAVALNYRTFITKPAAQRDDNASKSCNPSTPCWLTNVDVFWVSSGTLVVSTFSLPKLDIHCLDEVAASDEQKQLIGRCIRIAPNGLLAQVTSFEYLVDAATEDANQKSQRKKARVNPLEQGIEKWKANVHRWLGWKGYGIPALNQRNSWVRIRIPHVSQVALPSPTPFNSCGEILWPRALCFYYSNPLAEHAQLVSQLSLNQGENALSWFETTVSTGFKDPMDAAQQWFVGKLERDKIAEARRRTKKAEEDSARVKEESHGLFPSSPLNVRPSAYGDLQVVSGVYPTPPDGIVPGTTVSSGDTSSVTGGVTNVILASGGTNPAINISAPQETAHADSQEQQLQPLTSPAFPTNLDQYNADGENDDLFEDMDGDEFEGNGITDADFNFFDGPDGEDDEMLDAPSPEDVKPLPQKVVKEIPTTSAPDPKIKEEQTDPMTALENALATASGEAAQNTKSAEHEVSRKVTESLQVAPNPAPLAIDHSNVAAPVSKEPTPPLSPIFIEKVLFPSPENKSPIQSPLQERNGRHRDSVFDPLSFNQKMNLSDAKYRDGRFSFAKIEAPKLEKDKGVLRHPKSLRDLPLLTKLHYAVGVASSKEIPEMASLVGVDSDLSDTASDSSSMVDDEAEDDVSVAPLPLSVGLIMPLKRKLPTDGNATPLSATSFADSFGGDFSDATGLLTDASVLSSLEPTSSDWALVDAPAPAETSSASARYGIPTFSPIQPLIPGTPTSQPDTSIESVEERLLSGKDNIAVAQIVTDQIVSASLDLLHENSTLGTDIILHRPLSEHKWHGVIKAIFPKAKDCSVTTLVSTHDSFPDSQAQSKGQQRPPPRKPNESPTALGHQIYQISPPYIRVRRAEVKWDLLPPAVPFWEPLGLAPCSSAKNVVAFCIYPHSTSIKPHVESFMVNTQLAYDNCRLGNHARVETVPEYPGGLVPYSVSSPVSTSTAFKALHETCLQLGKLLAAKHAQMRDKEGTKIDAFVIYMVDPFESQSAIWELCSAFWSLFQAYGQGPPGRPDQIQKPDLVLQIVPVKYVASFEAPVILDASTYIGLAREVYDRCPPSAPSEDKMPLNIYTAPSFQLEEPIPRNVPFKLIAEPPQDLLHENSYIHLGYAVSVDGTWVTAAWTDVCGKSQAVVSYHLGTRMFGEIVKEIWQTTIEILSARKVTWRVCIARAGVMDKEEMEAWVLLVQCPTQLNLFITLLAVDTTPHLKFTPTMPTTNPSNSSSTGHPSSNTPGSTPQPGVSPEHGLTPAATPSADTNSDPASDPDARLVDTTDESWSIILAHRLHISNSTSEYRPALISGLLVKRGLTERSLLCPNTPDPERGPIIIAVNILWMGAVNPTRAATSPFPPSAAGTEGISPGGIGVSPTPSPQERNYSSLTWTPTLQTRAAAENLLREVLGQFRGLGLLARLRGMRGTRHGTVPWHVAAAMRGVRGLGMCLPT